MKKLNEKKPIQLPFDCVRVNPSPEAATDAVIEKAFSAASKLRSLAVCQEAPVGLLFRFGEDRMESSLLFLPDKGRDDRDIDYLFSGCARFGSREALDPVDGFAYRMVQGTFGITGPIPSGQADGNGWDSGEDGMEAPMDICLTWMFEHLCGVIGKNGGGSLLLLFHPAAASIGNAGSIFLFLPRRIPLETWMALPNALNGTQVEEVADLHSILWTPVLPPVLMVQAAVGCLITFDFLSARREAENRREQWQKDALQRALAQGREEARITNSSIMPLAYACLTGDAYFLLRINGIDTVDQFQNLTDEEVDALPGMTPDIRQETEYIHDKLGRNLEEEAMEYAQAADSAMENFLSPIKADPPAPPVSVYDSDPAKDPVQELQDLTGLASVKQQVEELMHFLTMVRVREEDGESLPPMSLHMVFCGNPGTGKTCVARILGKYFCKIGLLPNPDIKEVGRADLVGQFQGSTAVKVRKAFDAAKGRILFIDEAYSLLDDAQHSFGEEAINAIVQEMENRRQDTIVIFAGYPDQMEDFLAKNPGLKSRVPLHIDFPDYTPDELTEIACHMIRQDYRLKVSPDAREKIRDICKAAVKTPDFGNGRFCRNLVEKAVRTYACREYGLVPDRTKVYSNILKAEDFDASSLLPAAVVSRPIGF